MKRRRRSIPLGSDLWTSLVIVIGLFIVILALLSVAIHAGGKY